MTQPLQPVLQDIFLRPDGSKVTASDQWSQQRQVLLSILLEHQYGKLPEEPSTVHCKLLHSAHIKHVNQAQLMTFRVQVEGVFSACFVMQVWVPHKRPGKELWPVILTGDSCWHYATDMVKEEILRRGYVLAQFNRVELAADVAHTGPLPAYAALAIWAWGYHRCVDALSQLDFVQAQQIAIVGHSRGGKAALLAGATDERIALTSANNSGAGGAGSYQWLGQGAETLANMVQAFPHWFSPRLATYKGKESTLPFDQHYLKALIAPRALLTTEAIDDLWANPEGSWQTHLAAREVYRFLNAEQRIAMVTRAGGHAHTWADWRALLDFADAQWSDTYTLTCINIQSIATP
jgi:hypothetical protein